MPDSRMTRKKVILIIRSIKFLTSFFSHQRQLDDHQSRGVGLLLSQRRVRLKLGLASTIVPIGLTNPLATIVLARQCRRDLPPPAGGACSSPTRPPLSSARFSPPRPAHDRLSAKQHQVGHDKERE